MQICKCHKEPVSIYDRGRPVCDRTRLICDVWTQAVVDDSAVYSVGATVDDRAVLGGMADANCPPVPTDDHHPYYDPFMAPLKAAHHDESVPDNTRDWMTKVVVRAIQLAPDERAKHVLQLLWLELV